MTLLGAADLEFWQAWLSEQGLAAMNDQGRAQVILCAVDAKFMGLAFRELSISVAVCRQENGQTLDGAFLAYAFNSRPSFAFVERFLFHTPYYSAELQVDVGPPASFAVSRGGRTLLAASMEDLICAGGGRHETASGAREPCRRETIDWRVPIYLPKRQRSSATPGRMFYARLAGEAIVYDFLPERDELIVHPASAAPALQWLVDSHFTGREWRLRPQATHAKSKTVRRPAG